MILRDNNWSIIKEYILNSVVAFVSFSIKHELIKLNTINIRILMMKLILVAALIMT